MITQIIKFHVKPEKRQAVEEALLQDKKNSLQEEDCREMRLFVDSKDPNLLFAYERWNSQDAIDRHREQSVTKALGRVICSSLECQVEVFNLGDTEPAPVPPAEQNRPNSEDDLFIILFIFKFKEGYRERLLKRFEEHVTETRKEPGCILFDLYTVEGSEDTLAVYEHWRNESAVWDIHFKQPYSEITGVLMHEAVVGEMEQYMNFVKEIG